MTLGKNTLSLVSLKLIEHQLCKNIITKLQLALFYSAVKECLTQNVIRVVPRVTQKGLPGMLRG